MSKITDFFPLPTAVGGGGNRVLKTEEFLTSGTFTPTQALLDAGGVIEVFLVGGGQRGSTSSGGSGGEVITKIITLTDLTPIPVTIGAGAAGAEGVESAEPAAGGDSSFGSLLTALGGSGINGASSGSLSAGWGAFRSGSNYMVSAGSGVMGYGVGGAHPYGGVQSPKANSGSGSYYSFNSADGYCLIKWFE